MIAVNDSYCKYLFDNRYGTGQSVWDGIMRTTNLTVTGRTLLLLVMAGVVKALRCAQKALVHTYM